MGLTEVAAQESDALRELMKAFVIDMVKGRWMLVLVEGGTAEPCWMVLNPSLVFLTMTVKGASYEVDLARIHQVLSGSLGSTDRSPIPLDDYCSTVVLNNDECVTFRFPTFQARDEFTRCLAVLALAVVV